MSRRLSNLILLSAALWAGLFLMATEVQAQSSDEDLSSGIPKGVQVSPFRLDWDLNTGEERTGVINLKNYSDETKEVKVEVEDFYVSDDSSEARFFIPQESHPLFAYDVINWIDIPESVVLGPKEGKDIIFHVRVPEDIPTGGYYGATFFKTAVYDASNEESGAKVSVNQRVGVLLIMAVKGEEPIRMEGALESFRPKKLIFWDSPAVLQAEVFNSGNLHFKTYGKIDVFKFGKKVGSLELDPSFNYPGKIRVYDESWAFSHWAYGFYRARIYLLSEDQAVRLIGETNFWVIPWKETVFIIISLSILWAIYKWFNNKFEIKKKSDDGIQE